MKLSIITPFYNREDHLAKTIDSILVEKYLEEELLELILINDGSADNSKKIAEKYVFEHEQIKLISYEKNKGVNYARNQGIKSAKGDYITFLDSDDCLIEGSLGKIISIIRQKYFKHYLFLRDDYCVKPLEGKINYKDWVKGKLPADFLHVVESHVLKKNLFFENYSAYEELNWYRIIKKTEPLYLVDKVMVSVGRDRNDHLSNVIEIENIEKLYEKIDANITFLKYYGWDLLKYAPRRYFRRLGRIILTWAKLDYSQKTNSDMQRLTVPFSLIVSRPIVFLYRWWDK